jgi:hypothetical protein
MLWTDENAGAFIAEKFPSFKPIWDGYRFPIERIDALRYLLLYEFGGEFFTLRLMVTIDFVSFLLLTNTTRSYPRHGSPLQEVSRSPTPVPIRGSSSLPDRFLDFVYDGRKK